MAVCRHLGWSTSTTTMVVVSDPEEGRNVTLAGGVGQQMSQQHQHMPLPCFIVPSWGGGGGSFSSRHARHINDSDDV